MPYSRDVCFPAQPSRSRDLIELILGYGTIVGIIWTPEPLQRILSPIALVLTLVVVLARRQGHEELGLGRRGLVSSLWILPAAIVLAALSIFVAAKIGTLHPLYKGDFAHISGYVLWTIYQQFLLQDYFMARLLRLLSRGERSNDTGAIAVVAVLFAAAHLPNLTLTLATLAWGAVSCALFRRHRNLWMLGLAQGMLGLCFAVCVPDALHHHLRVGLGYLRYRSTQPMP
jgi:membrane protease YdiL (CAAX protease family)